MTIIRDPQLLIGALEEGELADAFRTELQETLSALSEAAGPKGKAKGHVTLKLNLDVAAGTVTITSDLTSKRPKEERRSSMYWVTEEGFLSTQHPKQHDMFGGPRSVSDDLGERRNETA